MSRPVLIALISALVMLGPFTNNIMVPSLPSVASALQVAFSDAQLILSVFMVGFAAGQLFVGPMSDRFGRKPVLVISLSLFVVASNLCAIAPDLETLSGAACYRHWAPAPQCRLAAPSSGTPSSSRIAQVYAYVGTALAIGPIIGPIFGGLIEVSAGAGNIRVRRRLWRADADLILVLLQETNRQLMPNATNPRRLIANYATLLSKEYMVYVMCNIICYGGIFAFTSCSAYIQSGFTSFAGYVRCFVCDLDRGIRGRHACSQPVYPASRIRGMIVFGGLVMTISGEII